MKITIPPSPEIIPSASKFVKSPGGRVLFVYSLKAEKLLSINSIGILLQSKITWKIVSKIMKKIMYPQKR